MGADWQHLTGKGGNYLVSRAAEIQSAGGSLSPIALRLIEEEVQRLKYMLSEELARLEPSGDLTPAAIATLRTLYQARLDAALRVLAAARGPAAPAAVPASVPSAAPAPASSREPVGSTLAPAPAPVAPPPAARVPRVTAQSMREFFADRSILIISYVGAFLLIVATLLFELDAFTALNGTARFVGVLTLDVVFGLAGWLCFRLPAMRLVGRTYVAISALMVPLTLIAAWTFLVLEQYGLHRDLAVALAGLACALLYGALALRLQSQGYAVLSMIALGIGWIAGLEFLNVGDWLGPLVTPLAAVYLALTYRWRGFAGLHAVFSRFAAWAIHAASVIALALTLVGAALPSRQDEWRLIAVTAIVLALVYCGHALLERSSSGAIVSLGFAGVAWVAAVNVIDPQPWTGLLMTPLIGFYIAVAYGSARVRGVGKLFTPWAELYVHAAAVLALGWTLYSAGTTGDLIGNQAWPLYAATLAAVSALYAIDAIRSRQRFVGLTSMVALGLAWLCVLNGLEIWPWRGLAFTPVLAFYILVASRRSDVSRLFASEPEGLIIGAAAIAAVWSVYATVSAPDLSAGAPWYPATATLAAIALLYGIDTWLRRDEISPLISMAAFLAAWIAGVSALQLGNWRGLALTPLVAVFSLIDFDAARFRPIGALYARWAEPFVHAVALGAIGWSAYPAVTELVNNQAVSQASYRYLAATFAVLTLSYALYSLLSKRVWMQWTVAIGVTLTTIMTNQALNLSPSALAVEFLALAIGKVLAARFYRGTRMHTFLYVTAAVQAVIAGVIPVEQDWLRALILLAAGLMGTFMAIDGDTPEWLYLATGFYTYGWYWLLKVVVPPPPHPGPSTLVLIYSPLPVIYTGIALALRRVRRAAWRLPLYTWAAAVAIGVVGLGSREGDYLVLGLALLAYSVAGYLATVLERIAFGVPLAAIAAAGGTLSLLQAASAPAGWYPPALIVVGWIVYGLSFFWQSRDPGRSEWTRLHRSSGLGLLAITALLSFGDSDFANSGNVAAFAGLAATWSLAAMMLIDGREYGTRVLNYVALVTASLGSYWIAHYLGAANPQWYVVAPGIGLIASGVLMQQDERLLTHYRQTLNAIILSGAALLLGTTSVQTLDPTLSVTLSTTLLLGEGIAALLVGIALRSRVLVLAGAAGVALASLRALVLLIQQVPLFIVFGLVAILLLGGAAALAVLRQRFADARLAMARSWQDWS